MAVVGTATELLYDLPQTMEAPAHLLLKVAKALEESTKDVEETVEEVLQEENMTFAWSTVKWALPPRFAKILQDNPLQARTQRRRIVGVLPHIEGLQPAAHFPSQMGIRTPPLDAVYQGWDNRTREIMRLVLMLHWHFVGEKELPENIKPEDCIEQMFALALALSKNIEQQRKGLIDRRLRPSDNEQGESLITAEDLKQLEKLEKMRRSLGSTRTAFNKGGKGKPGYKGRWHQPAYQPYRYGKGGKGGRGKSASAPHRPFSFLQIHGKEQTKQQ